MTITCKNIVSSLPKSREDLIEQFGKKERYVTRLDTLLTNLIRKNHISVVEGLYIRTPLVSSEAK